MNENPSPETQQTLELTPALVDHLRRGDSRAGVLLDRAYRGPLVRFCWGYLGSIDAAEDAVQDVCCKVLAAREFPDQFRPWIYRIARNHCINQLRARAARKEDRRLQAASQVHESLTGQLTRMVKDEARVDLVRLVESLSDEQREVLRLRYVEELSRSEVADVLGLPESTVKSRIFEAFRQLRRQGETES